MIGKLFSGAVVAACLMIGSSAHAAEILVNAGFESGALGPWAQTNNLSAGNDWSITNADAHSGFYSATDTGNKELQQNFAAVAGSLITSVTFWMKHPDGAFPAYVELLFSDGSSNSTVVSTAGSDWQFFNVTSLVNTSKSVTGLGIYGFCCSGASASYLDDLSIQGNVGGGVPEPATWALMLAGFGGLGAALRARRKMAMAAS